MAPQKSAWEGQFVGVAGEGREVGNLLLVATAHDMPTSL
jgi:hypothetical protein